MDTLLITIEGVDGVGKSTITKMLSDRIEAIAIQTPSKNLIKQRELIEDSNNRKEKFNFYINSIIHQQEEIKNLLLLSSVVCDRYTHSTFAYQWPVDKDLPVSINNFSQKIRKPDYSFLLIADMKERNERIKTREQKTGIISKNDYLLDAISIAETRYLKMTELFQIDTSNKTTSEVCDLIFERISHDNKTSF